ncbi:MAG: redoxin family protein [Pirellulales bacterium]|nr:redoxin family protein [Pirellulales bacterium]
MVFRRTLLASLLVVLTWVGGIAVGLQGAEQARPQIGDKLAACSFTDIRYLPRALSEFVDKRDPVKKRAFVLIFTNTTCPIVQQFLPRLKELDAEFHDQGVQFVAVNVGPDDSMLEIANQAVEHDMPFPFVKDIDGSCVAATGADRTPTAVLVDAGYRLRYRGRIDSSFRLGGTSRGALRTELKDAIVALLAGKEIAVTETPVDGCVITPPPAARPLGDIGYAKHIAPLFDRHCNACHREGTSAPFSLTSYDDVASNASMVAEVVEQRRMPPWYASPGIGHFLNDRTMPAADRKRLLNWLEAGAPEDDSALPPSASDPPPSTVATQPASFGNSWAGRKWALGEPDLVLEAPFTYDVPADGYVDYKYTLLPSVFLNDTYLQAVEVQPSNPRVVHHANLGYMPIGTQGMYARLITGYVPGVGPMQLDDGVASKIPKGSVSGLQIHLTTTGKPEKTKLRVGFYYPRYKVQKELHYLQLANREFAIPPFAAHHPVSRAKTLPDDVTLYGFFAHMHVRGKDVTFRAYPPSADPVTLLMIPNYNFDWQMPYYLAHGSARFPAGTEYECVAHYDNSTFNPYNPDPAATVRNGEQTIHEMMYGFVFYTKDKEQLNLEIDPHSGRAR